MISGWKDSCMTIGILLCAWVEVAEYLNFLYIFLKKRFRYSATVTIGKKLLYLHLFCASYENGWAGKKALARKWRKRAMPVARKAFSIISNYRRTLLAVAVIQWRQSPKRWRMTIISIMLLAAERREYFKQEWDPPLILYHNNLPKIHQLPFD